MMEVKSQYYQLSSLISLRRGTLTNNYFNNLSSINKWDQIFLLLLLLLQTAKSNNREATAHNIIIHQVVCLIKNNSCHSYNNHILWVVIIITFEIDLHHPPYLNIKLTWVISLGQFKITRVNSSWLKMKWKIFNRNMMLC